MGSWKPVSLPPVSRVVFDTNTILSSLLFTKSRLAWLRSHWTENSCVPIVSRATAAELARVLAYSKFSLQHDRRLELLGDYLPNCETIQEIEPCPIVCRDAKDHIFLDLAHSGRADILVSGDQDLLVLAGQTAFLIESPEAYRLRVHGPEPVT
jgi:putative PIN family toxin of toxin-antitoxin system